MNYIPYNPDDWETVCARTPCTSCNDDPDKCDGNCNGKLLFKQRPRKKLTLEQIMDQNEEKVWDVGQRYDIPVWIL